MQELVPQPLDRFVDPDRLSKVRDTLSEVKFDGLIGFAPANSYYLTGTYAGFYQRPLAGIVTESTSLFIGPSIRMPTVDRTSWVDRAFGYEDIDDPFEVFVEQLADLDVDVMGIDRDYTKASWLDALKSKTDIEFVDATETLTELRECKTDWELDKMRRALDLANAGMDAFVEGARTDRPEVSIVDDIQSAYFERYLKSHEAFDLGTATDASQYGFTNVLAGEHAVAPGGLGTSKQVGDGESVVGIAIPAIQGYIGESERTVLAGDPPTFVVEAMETLVEVRESVIDRLGPGENAGAIDEYASGRLADEGYAENVVHRTGHGEGITFHEGPSLNARKPKELEPGMVVTVEPGLYFPDERVALRHSDTVIITEDGGERMTDTDAGVLVVD